MLDLDYLEEFFRQCESLSQIEQPLPPKEALHNAILKAPVRDEVVDFSCRILNRTAKEGWALSCALHLN